jgi:YidC/Oxa1 family membrane protein insertase
LPEIHNPNLQTQGPAGGSSGGGGNEMRGLLTVMLIFLLGITGYQYFFRPKTAEPTPTEQQTQSQTTPAQAPANDSPTTTPGSAATASAAPVAATPAISAQSEAETTVENEWYKITFTNRGGQVKHWILKRYFDTGGAAGGHNLDMVQQQVAAQFGYPLSLFTYDAPLTNQLNTALYQVTADGSKNSTGSYLAPSSLTFHYAENGVDAVKTIHFDSTYVVTVDSEVKRNGAPVRALVRWPAGLGDMEEFLPSSLTRSPVPTSASSQLAWSIDGKQTTQGPAGGGFLFWTQQAASNGATYDQPFQYAALSDLYFTVAFLPDDLSHTTLVTLHKTIDLPSNLSDPSSQKHPAHLLGLAMGDTDGDTRLRLYAGPKAMDTLASIHASGPDGKPDGPSLEPLIQFGFWTFLAKPLYLALRFLYEHGIPNWGWAIIIVTVIFNMIMLWPRIKMMQSSLKMARIQPKVDAIKRKYANLKATDPKRAEMNTEMMALYKTEGVNMTGGCLPLVLQMPLFFAYYRVLANVIDLRQAHWFWLHDLSVPDPYYILPGIILVSMFLVQFITPSPGMDPAQRRMMAFMMPVIFGFSMSHFASGLALYWCTGNIINLIMQISINRSSIGQEMQALAAKRAAKRGGTGRR